MVFKIVYTVFACIPTLAGLVDIVEDVCQSRANYLAGMLSMLGLAFLQFGLLNLLNVFYGSSKPGIRISTAAMNLLSMGLVLWTIKSAWDPRSLLVTGVTGAVLLLSLFSLRRKTSIG